MTDDRSTAAELQRRLGLYTVIAISVGGMIGGGIFVLPGEAAKLAGPSALLAYLLAGFAVLPAVAIALLALGVFSVRGFSAVEPAAVVPFDGGGSGLLAATGLVFISSGVTKIASVAEEVREPGRTIPRAIIASVVLMMVVYTATVAVVVGTVPLDRLTPVGLASEFVVGPAGVVAMAVVATLALLGMANAGLLSSSR